MELEQRIAIGDPHLLLLQLVPAEDPDFPASQGQDGIEECVTERPRAAGDQHGLVAEQFRVGWHSDSYLEGFPGRRPEGNPRSTRNLGPSGRRRPRTLAQWEFFLAG